MKSRIILSGLILAIIFLATGVNGQTPIDKATATFAVTWYDVGAQALEGLPGVLSVTRGWRLFNEVNTVIYDPQKITVEQMVESLNNEGTYIKTLDGGP